MRSIKQPDSIKHIPQRTCVACRRIKPKRELVRLVRTSGGEVLIDTTGKTSGRGVYLCSLRECWETGLKGKQLEHALRTSITREDRERLINNMESLTKNAGE